MFRIWFREGDAMCVPSTSALNAKLFGMLEHCVAKVGMGYHCNPVASNQMDVKFFVPRFPRLQKEQTTNFSSVRNKDPVKHILNSVFKTQGAELLSYQHYDSKGR